MQLAHPEIPSRRKAGAENPHSTKDYIYIDDLAVAILLTMEKKFQGTINWGAGIGILYARLQMQ